MDHAMDEKDDRGEKQQRRPRSTKNDQTNKDDKSTDDDHDDDYSDDNDDDDRKPPAREVVVRRPESPASHLMSHDSTDESMSSSVMTPHAAPERLQLIPPSTSKLSAFQPTTSTAGMTTFSGITSLSHEEYQEQERRLRARILTLSGSSVFFMAYFLYVILPTAALASLAAIAVTSALAANEAYQYARIEFTDRLEHRGFGELLPDWLHQILTQRSLHEFLLAFHQRGDNQNRNRHLLLYLLPGLTLEQRTAYIERLPARHRRMLEQPGLGQLLGPDFMSFLLGRVQYNNQLQEQSGRRRGTNRHQPDPRIQVIEEEPRLEERQAIENAEPSPALRADDSSVCSDLGLDITPNDMAGGLTDEQARNVARDLRIRESAVTNESIANSADFANSEPEEEEDEGGAEEEEMRIIIEAALATMWRQQARVARTMFSNASRFISRTTQQVISSLASRGTRFALYTGGVGLIGVVTTAVVARGGRRGFVSSMIQDVLSPAVGERSSVSSLLVLGGAGAATAFYATHRMLQMSLRQSTAGKEKKNEKPSPKKKK